MNARCESETSVATERHSLRSCGTIGLLDCTSDEAWTVQFASSDSK
jgi:hypothetical protein